MTVLEKEIEHALVEGVRALSGLCLKWVCPGWAGVPDRIVLLPGGQIRFVELKRPGGGVMERQLWWQRRLRGLGFDCRLLKKRADVEALLADLKYEI